MSQKMRVLDLFSGIGGFSLGLERAGMETVAFCEIDPWCRKVLKKHWPDVRIYDDITRAKFIENVEMVTAGFPCQDISHAGKCAGITGERSGLFWYIIRTLCMVGRPKLLLENVAALLDRGMGEVLGALASFGYDTEWHCISASYVGAWHKRDRIWIFAHSNSERPERSCQGPILRQLNLSEEFEGSFEKWAGRSNLPASRFLRKADGVPHRVDRIRGLGNAVVPQIPEIIGRAIIESEQIKRLAA